MDKIYIDTIKFNEPLSVNYDEVFGMISSDHSQDCCERHELDFTDARSNFKMAETILTKIDKMEIYWEKNMWVTFFFYDWEERVGVFVPWRGYNNWYYWDTIVLIIQVGNAKYEYDVSEYQDY